ncbi:MAG: hypothetical protein M3Z29_11540 [Pseudomonadota bacterium]|nr:hypothetical protein [Pseudomonadota bacterium]
MSVLGSVRCMALLGLLAGTAGGSLAQSSMPERSATPVPSLGPSPAALAVEAFDVERVADLSPGVPLNFRLYGSPGAAVILAIEGSGQSVRLKETGAGAYEGAYVIQAQDRLRPDSRVVATLQRGGAAARATLAGPLRLEPGALPWAAAAAVPAAADVRAAPTCTDCAVVEWIHSIEAPPPGGLLHAFRSVLAGLPLGRQVDRSVFSPTGYDVLLRLPDGSAVSRHFDEPPGFRPGETVQLFGSSVRKASASAGS